MPEYMSMHNRRTDNKEGDSFFCRFTFGQFFALLVLEVLTLFFVFYLGARYGREFLGLEKKPAIVEGIAGEEAAGASSEEAKVLSTSDPEVAQMAKDLIAKAKTPELKDRISRMIEDAQGGGAKTPPVVEASRADEKTEVITPESADKEKPARADNETIQVGTPQSPQQREELAANTSTRPDAPAQNLPPSQQEDFGLKEQEKPTSVVRVKSVENGRYSVQVGSYPKLDEANRSVERWKNKGYAAYMMIADIPERGRWYRVRLGGFGTHEDANKYLKELKSRENVEAYIVVNEQ